ncbi:MAG: hypothetical protein P1U61_02115 [Legionellaceae bacterium]|nr:hypothetical protein [Legionellaceae bacterium]
MTDNQDEPNAKKVKTAAETHAEEQELKKKNPNQTKVQASGDKKEPAGFVSSLMDMFDGAGKQGEIKREKRKQRFAEARDKIAAFFGGDTQGGAAQGESEALKQDDLRKKQTELERADSDIEAVNEEAAEQEEQNKEVQEQAIVQEEEQKQVEEQIAREQKAEALKVAQVELEIAEEQEEDKEEKEKAAAIQEAEEERRQAQAEAEAKTQEVMQGPEKPLFEKTEEEEAEERAAKARKEAKATKEAAVAATVAIKKLDDIKNKKTPLQITDGSEYGEQSGLNRAVDATREDDEAAHNEDLNEMFISDAKAGMRLDNLPATKKELEKHYKKQALKRHPDRGGNQDDFTQLGEGKAALDKLYDDDGQLDMNKVRQAEAREQEEKVFEQSSGLANFTTPKQSPATTNTTEPKPELASEKFENDKKENEKKVQTKEKKPSLPKASSGEKGYAATLLEMFEEAGEQAKRKSEERSKKIDQAMKQSKEIYNQIFGKKPGTEQPVEIQGAGKTQDPDVQNPQIENAGVQENSQNQAAQQQLPQGQASGLRQQEDTQDIALNTESGPEDRQGILLDSGDDTITVQRSACPDSPEPASKVEVKDSSEMREYDAFQCQDATKKQGKTAEPELEHGSGGPNPPYSTDMTGID